MDNERGKEEDFLRLCDCWGLSTSYNLTNFTKCVGVRVKIKIKEAKKV